MSDIISINRLFLIMAREAAKTKSGEVLTGLSRQVLDRLVGMSLVEIENLAQDAGVSLISFRLSEADLERMVALQASQRSAAYSLSIAAGKGASNGRPS